MKEENEREVAGESVPQGLGLPVFNTRKTFDTVKRYIYRANHKYIMHRVVK